VSLKLLELTVCNGIALYLLSYRESCCNTNWNRDDDDDDVNNNNNNNNKINYKLTEI